MNIVLNRKTLILTSIVLLTAAALIILYFLPFLQEQPKTTGIEPSTCDKYAKPGGFTADFSGHGLNSLDDLSNQVDAILVAKIADCGPDVSTLKKGANSVNFSFSVEEVVKGGISAGQLPVNVTMYLGEDGLGRLESATPLIKRGQKVVLFLVDDGNGKYQMFREGNTIALETNTGRYIFAEDSGVEIPLVFSLSDLK